MRFRNVSSSMHGLWLILHPTCWPVPEFSLGTWETAEKLSYEKVTIKLREGPSLLVLKMDFLERGLSRGPHRIQAENDAPLGFGIQTQFPGQLSPITESWIPPHFLPSLPEIKFLCLEWDGRHLGKQKVRTVKRGEAEESTACWEHPGVPDSYSIPKMQ